MKMAPARAVRIVTEHIEPVRRGVALTKVEALVATLPRQKETT